MILLMILIAGCNRYTEEEVIALCSSQQYKGFEQGKILGESCSEEVKLDIWKRASEYFVDEYSNSFRENCLLIVTDGEEPQQASWYSENGFTQFDRDNVFPIRTWDLEKDQIDDGYDFNGWNYWVVCE